MIDICLFICGIFAGCFGSSLWYLCQKAIDRRRVQTGSGGSVVSHLRWSKK